MALQSADGWAVSRGPARLPEAPLTAVARTPALSDPVALLSAQLQALDAWNGAVREARAATQRPGLSREARLDAARALDVRLRERDVVLARCTSAEDARLPLLAPVPPRAVVAHRHPWTREALAAALVAGGVPVLEVLDNGADAVAVCVCEQPALLVLDRVLAMRSGAEVAAEVRQLSPSTVVTGYVADDAAVAELLGAGAAGVVTRRTPPAEAAVGWAALVGAAP